LQEDRRGLFRWAAQEEAVMKHQGIVLLAICLLSLSGVARSEGQDKGLEGGGVPLYMNAELVSADPARRVVVVRLPGGGTRSYEMDDLLAGAPGVKPGDRVILTLRGGSGVPRVSAIARASGRSSAIVIAKSPQVSVRREVDVVAAREVFARQVAQLADDARPVDVLWSNFVADCRPQPVSPNDGRAWFGLWDGRVQADYTTSGCREIFNQIVAEGEAIKQGMAAAEEEARKTLTPGNMRDIRKRHLMDWDGWALPAPSKREP
jgi:hypothetical protein